MQKGFSGVTEQTPADAKAYTIVALADAAIKADRFGREGAYEKLLPQLAQAVRDYDTVDKTKPHQGHEKIGVPTRAAFENKLMHQLRSFVEADSFEVSPQKLESFMRGFVEVAMEERDELFQHAQGVFGAYMQEGSITGAEVLELFQK